MKKLVLFLMVLVAGLLLGGCGVIRAQDRQTYFNGAVLVEYQQKAAPRDDSLTFWFYDKGTYDISFVSTRWSLRGNDVPQDFQIIVESSPRAYIVKPYRLPNYLTITIEHSGAKESREFK
ncbi:MAG: hypothetical protein Q7R84_00065 [bacterium]|nr:hypothetical protein [bacterium]